MNTIGRSHKRMVGPESEDLFIFTYSKILSRSCDNNQFLCFNKIITNSFVSKGLKIGLKLNTSQTIN